MSRANWSIREVPELVFALKEEILDDVRGLFFDLFRVALGGCT